MIPAIVFSRDRACQLDALLRSLTEKATPLLFKQTTVIYRATSEFHERGYVQCKSDHKRVVFHKQTDFRRDVLGLLTTGKNSPNLVAFFCDDDRAIGDIWAEEISEAMSDRRVICFSLRLGRNTTWCYPLHREMAVPFTLNQDGYLEWEHALGVDDFAYAGSLDGHVFRVEDVLVALGKEDFTGPNELEDVLNQGLRRLAILRPLMASFPTSRIVGSPNNLVNDSHKTNRFGKVHHHNVNDLNGAYLRGERIVLGEVEVTAAHQELELVLE